MENLSEILSNACSGLRSNDTKYQMESAHDNVWYFSSFDGDYGYDVMAYNDCTRRPLGDVKTNIQCPNINSPSMILSQIKNPSARVNEELGRGFDLNSQQMLIRTQKIKFKRFSDLEYYAIVDGMDRYTRYSYNEDYNFVGFAINGIPAGYSFRSINSASDPNSYEIKNIENHARVYKNFMLREVVVNKRTSDRICILSYQIQSSVDSKYDLDRLGDTIYVEKFYLRYDMGILAPKYLNTNSEPIQPPETKYLSAYRYDPVPCPEYSSIDCFKDYNRNSEYCDMHICPMNKYVLEHRHDVTNIPKVALLKLTDYGTRRFVNYECIKCLHCPYGY